MSRDYKRSGKKRGAAARGRRRGNPNGLLWLASGLVLGAVIGYVGYLLLQSGHGEEEARVATAAPASTPASAPAKPAAATPAKPAPKTPAAPPPPAEPPAKARFEFYTLLPEMEMEISDERVREALRASPKKSSDGPYILQVGSFRRAEEADSMKARLALLGIEASVQKVVIGNQDVWYRVRLGPYDSIREMGQARSRLQRNDIDFVVLRLGA